jgi:hypothetical protein
MQLREVPSAGGERVKFACPSRRRGPTHFTDAIGQRIHAPPPGPRLQGHDSSHVCKAATW